jgi:hypothetical protein
MFVGKRSIATTTSFEIQQIVISIFTSAINVTQLFQVMLLVNQFFITRWRTQQIKRVEL